MPARAGGGQTSWIRAAALPACLRSGSPARAVLRARVREGLRREVDGLFIIIIVVVVVVVVFCSFGVALNGECCNL